MLLTRTDWLDAPASAADCYQARTVVQQAVERDAMDAKTATALLTVIQDGLARSLSQPARS